MVVGTASTEPPAHSVMWLFFFFFFLFFIRNEQFLVVPWKRWLIIVVKDHSAFCAHQPKDHTAEQRSDLLTFMIKQSSLLGLVPCMSRSHSANCSCIKAKDLLARTCVGVQAAGIPCVFFFFLFNGNADFKSGPYYQRPTLSLTNHSPFEMCGWRGCLNCTTILLGNGRTHSSRTKCNVYLAYQWVDYKSKNEVTTSLVLHHICLHIYLIFNTTLANLKHVDCVKKKKQILCNV